MCVGVVWDSGMREILVGVLVGVVEVLWEYLQYCASTAKAGVYCRGTAGVLWYVPREEGISGISCAGGWLAQQNTR